MVNSSRSDSAVALGPKHFVRFEGTFCPSVRCRSGVMLRGIGDSFGKGDLE